MLHTPYTPFNILTLLTTSILPTAHAAQPIDSQHRHPHPTLIPTPTPTLAPTPMNSFSRESLTNSADSRTVGHTSPGSK